VPPKTTSSRPPRVGDLVRVVWDDANATHDEHQVGDWPDIATVATHGVLVKKTATALWVAGETLSTGEVPDSYRCTTVIPIAMVTKLEVLSV